MRRLLTQLGHLETLMAALCFSVSCGLIFISAILRSVGYPIGWAWDVTLFLFAWSVFLAADSALRQDKLVNVDLLVSRLPVRIQRLLAVANYVLILVFLSALVYLGIILSYITRARSFQGIPGFSYTWVTLSIPVGAALMIFTVLFKIRARLRS